MENYRGYAHTNKVNGKKYIGITKKTPQKRWGKNGAGYKPNNGEKPTKFWQAIEKYGWDGFEHEVLIEGMTFEEACQWEKDTIEKYNTFVDGYNSTLGGAGTPGVKVGCKPVVRINPNDLTDIKVYPSLADAEEDTEILSQNIGEVCNGYTNTAGGYYWCHQDQYETWQPRKDLRMRPVYCIETKIVYPSISDAVRNLDLEFTCIWSCCNGIIISHRGLHFCYAEDYTEDWQPRPKKQIGGYNKRPVICIETQMVFESVDAAGLYIDACPQNISTNCCKGHKTCRGFHFAYLEEYNENWEPAPEYDTERRKEASTLKKEVYCLQTNRFYSSATEAGEATGVEVRYVCKCCSGELIETHGYNYCWKEDWYEGWQPRKSIQGYHGSHSEETKELLKQIRRAEHEIEIICVETQKVYHSFAEAEEKTGIDGSSISKCCNKIPHYNTVGGYHWCYLSEFSTYVVPVNKKAKPVRNIDTGEVFPSITEAKKKYKGDISGAIRKGHKAGGCRWEYA